MIQFNNEKFNLCIFPAPPEPQTVTATPGSNNVVKASNGNSVLHRVITLTTADNNLSGKPPAKPTPAYVPEKLHFSAYEKFEGESCLRCRKRKEVN